MNGSLLPPRPCPTWLVNWYEYLLTSEPAFEANEHLSFKQPTNATARWTVYASRAVQFDPNGGQFGFVWLPVRTMHPHGAYVL